jgi:hypothetical protein
LQPGHLILFMQQRSWVLFAACYDGIGLNPMLIPGVHTAFCQLALVCTQVSPCVNPEWRVDLLAYVPCMPCVTCWHVWLCHKGSGRTLVLSPSTYSIWWSRILKILSTSPWCRLIVPVQWDNTPAALQKSGQSTRCSGLICQLGESAIA